jgi:hypothetical protein
VRTFSLLFAGNFAGTYFCSGIIGMCRLFGRNIGFKKISESQRTRDRVLNLPLSDRSKIDKKSSTSKRRFCNDNKELRLAKGDL